MKTLRYIYSALAAMCLTVFAGCSPEELSTDQYTDDAVALSAYGPQPVARGGELRFLGSNLDRIVSVVIPGVDPVTEINVIQAGVPSEIRIIVPKDGPEPGLLTLVADDGTEIVTKTELTYSEPIVLDGFSPASVKPGDVITIKGDYLNLINEVVFAEEVIVSGKDFVKHDRYEIQVKVPAEAQTGEIGLGDLDMTLPENDGLFPNVIYSEGELAVVLPVLAEMSPLSVRPGDNVTISGTLMDNIVSVVFAGSSEIPVADFVSQNATDIVVAVPFDAHDGQVTCITASGIELVTEESVTIDVPTVSAVTAESRFKAGLNVLITGEDLDMVTGVTFSGDVAAEFSYADDVITAVIPASATDGVITLTTGAEKTVATETVTFVRPAITSFEPATVTAGDEFGITGNDLDLVTGVSLNGETLVFELNDEKITVTTTPVSSTGSVTLTLANGTTVESDTEVTVEYETVTVVSEITESVAAGDNVTMTGMNFNMIESIFIGETKVTSYTSRSDTEIVFTVPDAVVPGTYNPEFVLTTGERETSVLSFAVEGAEKTVWEGNLKLTWSKGGRVCVPAAPFEDLPAGSQINFYFDQIDQTWGQMQFNNAAWSEIVFPEVGKQTFVPTEDAAGWGWTFGSRCLTCTLTQEILDNILSNRADIGDEGVTDCGIIIQGSDIIFTKITVKSI